MNRALSRHLIKLFFSRQKPSSVKQFSTQHSWLFWTPQLYSCVASCYPSPNPFCPVGTCIPLQTVYLLCRRHTWRWPFAKKRAQELSPKLTSMELTRPQKVEVHNTFRALPCISSTTVSGYYLPKNYLSGTILSATKPCTNHCLVSRDRSSLSACSL